MLKVAVNMDQKNRWKAVGWDKSFWELVRFYCSLRGTERSQFVDDLAGNKVGIGKWKAILGLEASVADLLREYIDFRGEALKFAIENLRSESDAKKFCKSINAEWKITSTKNKDHHQSSKAVIAAVTTIAEGVVKKHGISIVANPQRRCVWTKEKQVHVSARNLDGAIPSLENPFVVWEIKEYWGKTSGGSKMSDAVYECHLVGKVELTRFCRHFSYAAFVNIVNLS